MDIINIITTENNSVLDIKSFAVVNPETSNDVTEQAEKEFSDIIRNFRKPDVLSDEDVEIYIEDGFSYKGINVNIVWSNSINE